MGVVAASPDDIWGGSILGSADWRARVRALPVVTQRALLARAEGLPSDDTSHDLRLRHLSSAVAPALDPADPADARCLRRVLDAGWGFDAELESVMRRAADGTPDRELLWGARAITGQWCIVRDQLDEAERWYRLVLHETRGSGRRIEGIVTVNFARLCMGARREIEAIVLVRRAIEIFDTVGETRGATYARVVEAHVLAHIEDWDRLEALLEHLKDEIARVESTHRAGLEDSLVACQAELWVARARYDEALACADRLDAAVGKNPVHTARSALLIRIRALLASGRTADARATVEKALALGPDDDEEGLRLSSLEVVIALECEDAGVAELAKGWLERIERPGRGAFGPGRRLVEAQRVADALHEAGLAPEIARRAYDLAASDALARLVELDRFARDFGPAAAPDADDRATLEDYRVRTSARRARLLDAVSDLLVAEAHAGRWRMSSLAHEGGLVRTCAWCGDVETRLGAWIPMPEMLPTLPMDGPTKVTHGVCHRCGPTLHAELDEVRRTAPTTRR